MSHDVDNLGYDNLGYTSSFGVTTYGYMDIKDVYSEVDNLIRNGYYKELNYILLNMLSGAPRRSTIEILSWLSASRVYMAQLPGWQLAATKFGAFLTETYGPEEAAIRLSGLV